MTRRFIHACTVALCLLTFPATALAQRALHWVSVEVVAHLDAEGRLLVTETQTMVFSGDWNGGERRFNIRPRQRLQFDNIQRAEGGGWKTLVRDSSLDDVDDYAFTDDATLRWRSRLATDAPFANATRTYILRYRLSNILVKNGDGYKLDHDFLFPERQGVIARASVALTLDPVWQPQTAMQDRYTAEQVPLGRGLLVTIPLRYTGGSMQAALSANLSPAIVRALWTLLIVPIVVLGWLFARERHYGRFGPLHANVDEAWIRQHILAHPAEVVAAAWDDEIKSAEVVALIARLVAEGKLKSGTTKKKSMQLHLVVNRNEFDGYERALIDGLFYQKRFETSTEGIQKHYSKTGFDPAGLIRAGLKERAAAILPPGEKPWRVRFVATVLYAAGVILVAREWSNGYLGNGVAALLIFGTLPFLIAARQLGLSFRANIQWGPAKAVSTLIPIVLAIGLAALYLWRWADGGVEPASNGFITGVVLLALSVLFAGVGAMKSKQHRAALAYRKLLASGREFFIAELAKEQPALRDKWFPWVLAFGLGKQMDDWSARAESEATSAASVGRSSSSSSSSEGGSASWTGFAAGRSGGGGGGASWSAAAAGMAAPVAAAGSSSSSGGSTSSGGGGSSSGGSSGGGGGGGW